MTKNDLLIELESARETIQENLLTFLDGMPDETLDAVCQAVVDGFKPIIEKIEQNEI